MRIEAGLSTYEKELALMGEDYQDIFRQQVRGICRAAKSGLSRPVWIAQAYQQQDKRRVAGRKRRHTT